MTNAEIMDDQISCSSEDFDLDILSENFLEIVSEIKSLRKKAVFSEKLSAHKFDLMSAVRFGNSLNFLEGVEGQNGSTFESINFPKLTPFMLPSLIEEKDGQFFPTDNGNSRIFGCQRQRIKLNASGEFSLFKNLFALVPDLQSKARKANLVQIQQALKDERNFPQPVSDAVSL